MENFQGGTQASWRPRLPYCLGEGEWTKFDSVLDNWNNYKLTAILLLAHICARISVYYSSMEVRTLNYNTSRWSSNPQGSLRDLVD